MFNSQARYHLVQAIYESDGMETFTVNLAMWCKNEARSFASGSAAREAWDKISMAAGIFADAVEAAQTDCKSNL